MAKVKKKWNLMEIIIKKRLYFIIWKPLPNKIFKEKATIFLLKITIKTLPSINLKGEGTKKEDQ